MLAARRREGVTGLLLGLVVALLLHALLLPAVGVLLKDEAPRHHERGSGAQLVRLSPAAFDKNRRVEIRIRDAADEERARAERERREEEEARAPGQVVSLPPPEREERPEQADYASEWDQRAERETRSRDQRAHAPSVTRGLSAGLATKLEHRPSTVPSSPMEGRDREIRDGSGPEGPGRATSGDSGTDTTDGQGERMFALEIPRQAAREPLKLRLDPDGLLQNRTAIPEVAGNGDTARVAMGNRPADAARRSGSGGSGFESGQGLVGGGNGTAGLPTLERLTPAAAEILRVAGAPANDWLPEVEVDAETRLNAWRWKHATFFNRIADAIRREWQGGEVLSSNDPAGNVYGFSERVTVLQVTLDRAGHVVEVNVAEPSGAVVLDDEAIRAFKQAAPFANPPSQLFQHGERFTFLFGFNVSYNRTNFDLMWRPN